MRCWGTFHSGVLVTYTTDTDTVKMTAQNFTVEPAGEVRNMIRSFILSLMGKAKILVLTSHARTDYQAARQRQVRYEPRANPAFSELADVSVQLIREPNQRVPYGLIEERDRSMSLPPRIDPCTWEKMLGYLLEQPADWENLKPEEMAPERLYIDPSANAEEIS